MGVALGVIGTLYLYGALRTWRRVARHVLTGTPHPRMAPPVLEDRILAAIAATMAAPAWPLAVLLMYLAPQIESEGDGSR